MNGNDVASAEYLIKKDAVKAGFLLIDGNIWKQETAVQKQLRAEHEKYVAGLRIEHEKALAQLRDQAELDLAKERAKSATALAAAERELAELQRNQVKLIAEVHGRGALINTLSNALAAENPQSPLVPMSKKEEIISGGRKEQLLKMGVDPNTSFC